MNNLPNYFDEKKKMDTCRLEGSQGYSKESTSFNKIARFRLDRERQHLFFQI